VEWSEFLDDVEGRLADVDRALNTGGAAVSPFEMPDDLGPLPEELQERASQALQATVAKQVEVETARNRIADALRQGRVVTREPAAYFDSVI
jgi:hypothetical protein